MNVRSAGIGALAFLLCCVRADAATEAVVYAFTGGADGANPPSSLLDVGGSLYGVTSFGGSGACSGGCGTVFSINPETGAETVIHSFNDDGADGYVPSGALINVHGTLYGTTALGGTGTCENGCGTVFAIDLNTGDETVIYSFQDNGVDGISPNSGLTIANGILYGTAALGGANCPSDEICGTVFSIDPTTGSESTLYSFCAQQNCSDGLWPTGPLLNVNGTFYGTTVFGGSNANSCGSPVTGCGTVFSLVPDTGAEKVLYSFCQQTRCADGYGPAGGLRYKDGTLYGATTWGGSIRGSCSGAEGCGTIFSLNLATDTEAVTYTFCTKGDRCKTGYQPNGGLIGIAGKLYGTTVSGGLGTTCYDRCGTVFWVNPLTGKERQLYSFAGGTDGATPTAGLLDVKGTLYGTTEYGGTGAGTVFSITP